MLQSASWLSKDFKPNLAQKKKLDFCTTVDMQVFFKKLLQMCKA